MKLDEEQEAAYRADQNVVVSAGAGSGKTTVLAERYVRLVTERDLGVNEVLTLTFTRKAAAEMYERIFKRLSRSQDPRAQEKLAQFDQARISTLDSFCAAIARGASYRYGISGDFRLDEAELKEAAEEAALDMVMRRRHTQAIRRHVSARGFEEVVKNVFAALAQDLFSLVKPANYKELGKKQIAFIARKAEERAGDVAALCETIAAIDPGKKPAIQMVKAQEAVKRYAGALDSPLECSRETLREAAAFFAGSESFTLRFGNPKSPDLLELKEAAVTLKKEAAPELLTLAKSLIFADDIAEIGEFLDDYQDLLLERKRARGLLSFRDAAELAVDILLTDMDLRNYYKRHIKAVMIDEFQDNNETQKNLLYLLAEQDGAGKAGVLPRAQDLCPDKLFFVGDEKQSIYRFRGADVSVFRGLARELGERQGEHGGEKSASLTLSANYRSAPKLAEFFNALFPGVFGPGREPFEAAFSPMRSAPDAPYGPDAPVEVFLQELRKKDQEAGSQADDRDDEEDGETPKEIGEALAMATRIINGVQAKEFGFGDVAVLFRNTTSQSGYERVFRDAGIPFKAVDPRGLFLEAPANDFYAILRLVLFPLDRNAYAATLRSLFAGLDDRTPDTPFPPEPGEHWFDNQAEQERYDRAASIFAYLKSAVDSKGVAEIMAYLWHETGYRAYLLYHEGANLDHFDYLYTLALDADRRRLNMAAFLDELAPRIGTSGKAETGGVPEQGGNTLFITAHKSKGLEFPVVILANAGSKGRGPGNRAPYFLDPEYGPALNLKMDTDKRNEKPVNYFYGLRQDLNRRQEEAELKRLFYVAATRAKNRLIIVGSRKTGALIDDEGSGEDRGFRNIPRESGGETPARSFLDFFSQGVMAAESGLPPYRLTPITPPSWEAYGNAIRSLKARASDLVPSHAPEPPKTLKKDDFYRLPLYPPLKAGPILTSPTQLESPVEEGGIRLPPFRSDPYLDAPPARGGARAGEEPDQPDGLSFSLSSHTIAMKRAFGKLCHRIIEKMLEKKTEHTYSLEEASRDAASLFHAAGVSKEALAVMAEEARHLARRFLETPLGKGALGAERRDSEFRFILPAHERGEQSALIRGAMDLIYETQEACVIIDFKTDRYLNPGSHRVQLACYTLAAKAFSDLPARTLLVYLRDMRAVEMTSPLSKQAIYRLAVGNALGKPPAERPVLSTE